MAKIAEQLVAIRVQKLVKENESTELDVVTLEIQEQLAAVLEELLGGGYVVEAQAE